MCESDFHDKILTLTPMLQWEKALGALGGNGNVFHLGRI